MGNLFDWWGKDKASKLINDLRLTIKYLNECIESEKLTIKELADFTRSKQKHIDKLYEDVFELEHELGIAKDYIGYLESTAEFDKTCLFMVGLGLGIFLTVLLVLFGVIV